ncbi:hypothetical protein LINGRAPRIM_LOCUS3243 [Linum grandiflorum]
MVTGKAAPLEGNLEEKMVYLNLTSHEHSIDVMDDQHTGLPLKSELSSSDEKLQSTPAAADHKNDGRNSHYGIHVDHQNDSSQLNGKETEPTLQTSKHNNISLAAERHSPSLIKQPQPNTHEEMQVMIPAAEVDIDRLSQHSLEPMCSSSRSGSGVGIHLPDLGAVPPIPIGDGVVSTKARRVDLDLGF